MKKSCTNFIQTAEKERSFVVLNPRDLIYAGAIGDKQLIDVNNLNQYLI